MADQQTTGFDVNEWLDESRGQPIADSRTTTTRVRQARPPAAGLSGELLRDLAAARNAADWGRFLTLAQALRSQQGGVLDEVALADVDRAAQVLVQSELLDLAASWADAWASLGRAEQAKSIQRQLNDRLKNLRAREQRLRDCLAGGPLSALVLALHELASGADRATGTDTLLAEAQQALENREKSHALARQRLELLLPARLDEAVALMTAIFNEEPDRTNQEKLASLHARCERARAHAAVAQTALSSRHLPDVERALANLSQTQDRVVHATTLEAELRALQDELRALVAERRSLFQAALDAGELDEAIRLLRSLILLDPRLPESVKLDKLLRQRDDLQTATGQLRQAMTSKDPNRIQQATVRFTRVAGTNDGSLAAEATALAEEQQVRSRRARRVMVVVCTALVLGFIAAVVVRQRDRAAYQAAVGQAGEARIAALQAYCDDRTHLLHREAAQLGIDRTREDLADAQLETVLTLAKPAARIAAVEAWLAEHPAGSGHDARRTRAAAGLAAARAETDHARYAAALRAPSAERLAALESYVTAAEPRQHDAEARAHILALRQEQDLVAWQAADAVKEPAGRIAAMDAYLAGGTLLAHAETARTAITAARSAEQDQAALAADDAAWQAVTTAGDATATQAALAAYLARPAPRRHEHRAHTLSRDLARRHEDEAWAAIVAAGEPAQQLSLAEAYLAAGGTRASEAARIVESAARAVDQQAWAQADLPGPAPERIRRCEAYLAAPHRKFREEDARTVIAAAKNEMEQDRWSRVQALSDPVAKLLALDGWLAEAPEPERQRQLSLAQRDTLAVVSALDDARLSLAAPEVLARLDGARLERLPPGIRASLPAEVLLTLPPENIAGLGRTRLAAMPVPVRQRALRRPAWAVASGVDADGPWAELALDRERRLRLRLRHLPPGSLSATIAGQAASFVVNGGFWLGETELDQAVLESVLGRRANVSAMKGPDLPAQGVSAAQADALVEELRSDLRRTPGSAGLRLPTTAELALAGLSGLYAADWPQPQFADWSPVGAHGEVQPARGGADGKGFHHLLGNVAEWAVDGESRLVALGPFPTKISSLTTSADAAVIARTGLRLAISADDAVELPIP